jgi:hypothetical protein
MSLLREPRCLRCGSGLPLKVLWDFAGIHDQHLLPERNLLTRAGLLRGAIGIRCPSCGAAYRVVQTRIRMAYTLTWITLLGTAASLEDWTSHHVSVFQQKPLSVLVVLVFAFVVFLLLRIYTPRLALVRAPQDGEKLTFPLDPSTSPSGVPPVTP